jgi:hypothetical protein
MSSWRGAVVSHYLRFNMSYGGITVKIVFKVDDMELPVTKDALCSLLDFLPEKDSSLAEALHVLACSPSAEVRQAVARRPMLNEATVALLVNDTDPQVVDEVVSCHGRSISDDALLAIIERRWSLLNTRLANSFGNHYHADIHAIAKALAADKDPGVRCAVASNSSTPRSVLKALVKDADDEVKRRAAETLADL